MSESNLVIVGDGPAMELAAGIAERTRPAGSFRLVDLHTDDIGSTDLWFLADDDPARTQVFAAVGFHALNFARYDLWAKFRFKGYKAATLVHPTADIEESAKVSENCLIGPFVSIGANAKVGRATVLIGRNDIALRGNVGPFSWMARGASIGSSASVGSHVVLGENVMVCDGIAIGDYSEIAVPGTYRHPIAHGTFLSPSFDGPARMIGDTWSNAAVVHSPNQAVET